MEWINVKKRLPEYRCQAGGTEFTHCLGCMSGTVTELMFVDNRFSHHQIGDVHDYVTHWMYLPDPPKPIHE